MFKKSNCDKSNNVIEKTTNVIQNEITKSSEIKELLNDFWKIKNSKEIA